MAFTKITDADLQGKGVVGQAPVPGLPVKEMQESVEQIVREVAIPGINRLADELGAQTAAKNIGMQVPDGMPGGASANVSSIVATHVLAKENPHNVTAEQVGAYTKEQTDQAINQKVQDIGSGDMSKSEYATTGTYGAVDRALSADRAAQSDDGVKVYTHSKSGTVHEFTGTGANGRAKMTADVQAGDTFTVNGAPVTAYMGAESAADAMAGSEWNGKWVTFVTQYSTISFSGGASGAKVTFDKVEKTGSESSEASQTWEATCEQPCICDIVAAISVARGSYGSLTGFIRKNGEDVITGEYRTDSPVSGGSYLTLPAYLDLQPGDTVRVWVHTSHYAKATMTLNVKSTAPISFNRVS